MSNISIDPLGSIVTLKVRAFAPDDARRINETVLQVSEEMLNSLLNTSRGDALRIAEQDKQRAGEDLEALRREIENFRRQSGVLDPQSAGSSALELILSRRAQRAALAAELQATLASLSPRSAQVRSLKARIAALDEQIAALEEDLAKGGDGETIASLISTYEELGLKRAFAEQTFTLAEMTLLRTKAEIERWHVYLVPVTRPDTPIEAVEPRPFAEAAHIFLIAFVIWGIVSLLALGTAEHRQ
jgi:capsular polysaccharide transport system permease protein